MLARPRRRRVLIGRSPRTRSSAAPTSAPASGTSPRAAPSAGARLRGLIKRSMGPVWEANHVWLIVVLVIMWTCFPRAFGPLMETLYVPAVPGGRRDHLPRRGVRAAGRGGDHLGGTRARRDLRALVGADALLPRVRDRRGRLRPGPGRRARPRRSSSWTNATSLLAGALAVLNGAYLAAVFLAADARARASTTSPTRSAAARSAPASPPGRSRSAGSQSSSPTPPISMTGSPREWASRSCSSPPLPGSRPWGWSGRAGSSPRATGPRWRSARSSRRWPWRWSRTSCPASCRGGRRRRGLDPDRDPDQRGRRALP